ncbi:hypothetical protein C8Q79DRAFT_903734 [Trametes meyenii]|nr:hypothetical protein C8Q79DRAFT_903734 [Trametes meyenii]
MAANTERTRSESCSLSKSSEETPVTMKQDADFWFEDGSVVIVAEDTGFRVHRSLLARVSSVFQDTFSIPQPPDAHAHQGVPALELQDSAHDMKCLLYAIYDGRKYLGDMEPHIPFVILSAHIRLGHKYDIPEIVDQAVGRLETYFTTDLETWAHNEHISLDSHLPFDFSDRMIADVFETVNLARLIERPTLLPAALYFCCQQEPDDLLLGIPRADPGHSGDAAVMRLNDDDARRCNERSISYHHHLALALVLNPPSPTRTRFVAAPQWRRTSSLEDNVAPLNRCTPPPASGNALAAALTRHLEV